MSKSRNSTARMLITEVKSRRPDWTARQCAEWLRSRMPRIKRTVRRRVHVWIGKELP